MMEDQQQYMNVLLTQIDQKLGHIVESSRAEWQRQLAQLQEIALVIVRKILPNYIAQHGLGEVETIVAKVISEVGRELGLCFEFVKVNSTTPVRASMRLPHNRLMPANSLSLAIRKSGLPIAALNGQTAALNAI